MPTLMEKAFEKATRLPEGERDDFARFILAELESEERWSQLFSTSESEDLLGQMADDALEAHRKGRTQRLDPESL